MGRGTAGEAGEPDEAGTCGPRSDWAFSSEEVALALAGVAQRGWLVVVPCT